ADDRDVRRLVALPRDRLERELAAGERERAGALERRVLAGGRRDAASVEHPGVLVPAREQRRAEDEHVSDRRRLSTGLRERLVVDEVPTGVLLDEVERRPGCRPGGAAGAGGGQGRDGGERRRGKQLRLQR